MSTYCQTPAGVCHTWGGGEGFGKTTQQIAAAVGSGTPGRLEQLISGVLGGRELTANQLISGEGSSAYRVEAAHDGSISSHPAQLSGGALGC